MQVHTLVALLQRPLSQKVVHWGGVAIPQPLALQKAQALQHGRGKRFRVGVWAKKHVLSVTGGGA